MAARVISAETNQAETDQHDAITAAAEFDSHLVLVGTRTGLRRVSLGPPVTVERVGPPLAIRDVAVTDDRAIWFSSGWHGIHEPTRMAVGFSDDRGETWTIVQDSDSPFAITRILSASRLSALILGDDGWLRLASVVPAHGAAQRLITLHTVGSRPGSGNHGVHDGESFGRMVCMAKTDGLWASTNSGQTWNRVLSSSPITVDCGERGCVVGEHSGTVRFLDYGTTVSRELTTLEGTVLIARLYGDTVEVIYERETGAPEFSWVEAGAVVDIHTGRTRIRGVEREGPGIVLTSGSQRGDMKLSRSRVYARTGNSWRLMLDLHGHLSGP
jgi:hypothetical protein